jgi:hypothetical protein
MVVLGGGAFSYERGTPVRSFRHTVKHAGFVPSQSGGWRD